MKPVLTNVARIFMEVILSVTVRMKDELGTHATV